MARPDWEELPDAVRRAVENESGAVLSAVPPSAGRNSDFLATLQTERGFFFIKGALAGTKKARMQQVEASVNTFLPHTVAPRLLWEVKAGGWNVLGFEHTSGRHADLTPGSADLPMVADTLATLVSTLGRCPIDLPHAAQQWKWMSPWRRLADSAPDKLDAWDRKNVAELVTLEYQAMDAMRGDSLVHGDMHPLNILVADRVRIIDWAWASQGAAWLDTTSLVLRLVAAGHTPAEAEAWASKISAFRDAPESRVTAYAVVIMGMWAYRGNFPKLTDAARRYVQYRLEK
ncbi:phosphotransferase family protein [Amycolatopsis sp. NPDC059027]|uniref:phosphotransferase family protein n=1 Tax=Amycolatopsis sp. NPDC059027 TaxID=3346709 RepID=UPI00366B7EF8